MMPQGHFLPWKDVTDMQLWLLRGPWCSDGSVALLLAFGLIERLPENDWRAASHIWQTTEKGKRLLEINRGRAVELQPDLEKLEMQNRIEKLELSFGRALVEEALHA